MTDDYMVQSSGDDSEASDYDIEEHENKAYEELKRGKVQFSLPNKAFTCLYCPNKKRHGYQYKELLQHATMAGTSDSRKRSKREKVNHLALAKYLEKDISEACGHSRPKDDFDRLTDNDGDDMFVCPWKSIVANLPMELIDGRYVGKSGSVIRDDLAMKGFNPKRVHLLWNSRGHSGCAVIDFGKDLLGFYNAMKFEKAYEADHHGKKDWSSNNDSKSGIYGWVARGNDYTSINVYGEHLCKSADVMTLSDIMADEHRKRNKLKENLTNMIEVEKRKYEEMRSDYMETKNNLSKKIVEKDDIFGFCKEDTEKMEMLAIENCRLQVELESHLCNTHTLAQENDKLKREITHQQKELKQRAKRHDERDPQIAPNSFDSSSSMIARNKELEEKVTELEEELQYKDSLNQTLMTKEHNSNSELRDARKELINALRKDMNVTTGIGLKRMGDVVSEPFQDVCMQKYSAQDWDLKSMEITSLWQDRVNTSQWHPFKQVFKDGKLQEIVDEDDDHMKELRSQWGEEAYNAVANALLEMNEHNASGRYVESVLWNFKEGRKANLKEVIVSLINQLKAAKSVKRTRTGQQQN